METEGLPKRLQNSFYLIPKTQINFVDSKD
jgi:hypothetical protein